MIQISSALSLFISYGEKVVFVPDWFTLSGQKIHSGQYVKYTLPFLIPETTKQKLLHSWGIQRILYIFEKTSGFCVFSFLMVYSPCANTCEGGNFRFWQKNTTPPFFQYFQLFELTYFGKNWTHWIQAKNTLLDSLESSKKKITFRPTTKNIQCREENLFTLFGFWGLCWWQAHLLCLITVMTQSGCKIRLFAFAKKVVFEYVFFLKNTQ